MNIEKDMRRAAEASLQRTTLALGEAMNRIDDLEGALAGSQAAIDPETITSIRIEALGDAQRAIARSGELHAGGVMGEAVADMNLRLLALISETCKSAAIGADAARMARIDALDDAYRLVQDIARSQADSRIIQAVDEICRKIRLQIDDLRQG